MTTSQFTVGEFFSSHSPVLIQISVQLDIRARQRRLFPSHHHPDLPTYQPIQPNLACFNARPATSEDSSAYFQPSPAW